MKRKLNVLLDLNEICTAALLDFELLASEQKIQLVGDLPEPSGKVQLDAPLFRRVLDNLISNAIKFSTKNSQVILKAYYPTPEKVVVQVIDSGTGISEQFQEAIFKKYKVGNLVEGVNQVGLGLAFCKMVIDAHGGKITVENNHPSGAIFTIEIATNIIDEAATSKEKLTF